MASKKGPQGLFIRLSLAHRGAHHVRCLARPFRAVTRIAQGEAEVLAR